MNASECTILSTSGVSDDSQHTQQHACGPQHTYLTFYASYKHVTIRHNSTDYIRGQRQNNVPTFRALNYVPHTFIYTTKIVSLTVTCRSLKLL